MRNIIALFIIFIGVILWNDFRGINEFIRLIGLVFMLIGAYTLKLK